MALKLTYEELERRIIELEKESIQRERAEESLRDSERRYRDLYENAPNAYFSVGKTSVLLVPKTALAECGQLASVYVVGEDGIVRKRLVKTGKEYDDSIQILSGITPGESVVVRDLLKVTEGCTVGTFP